ncbi:hypothetical protein N9K45_00270, partial [bacterium]|nr:hypothetical protein [bacterium]
NCIPVSLYEDAAWHIVEVNIAPTAAGGAVVTFDFDSGAYGGFGLADGYTLPQPAYLGFTARTGGATNNHWVRNINTGGAWVFPPPPPPPPPLPVSFGVDQFALTGSAAVVGNVLQLTQTENSQTGTAFAQVAAAPGDDFQMTIRYEMYTGDGSGADGQCVNIGNNDLMGRDGEDGVAEGVAVCFDEWANSGDHGVTIFYNSAPIWENIAPCNNRENCIPVSLYDDAAWHTVEVKISPLFDGSAQVSFSLDNGMYSGFGQVIRYLDDGFTLPSPTYLGFTARTGGATNNHWVRNVATSSPAPPPYEHAVAPRAMTLGGSSLQAGDVVQLTQVAGSQTGTAFTTIPGGLLATDSIAVRYWMYTGDGSGADGQCVNIGNNDLGGRVAENGVTQGLAVCFDEWANAGDHGVAIYWNAGNQGDGDTSRAGAIWENIAPCNNRENCIPVSLFDDAAWHVVDVAILPNQGGAQVVFNFDNGIYGGFGTISGYSMPSPTYVGFTARTGGATNNHWIRDLSFSTQPANAAALVRASAPTPPAPPLANQMTVSRFTLSGSAIIDGQDTISLTQVANSQQGTAFSPVQISGRDDFSVQYSMYCGGGTGADGMCVNVGSNDMGGRVGEDGVSIGVAVCFDEWANNGDHGVSIFYNGGMIWENIALCDNRDNCVPVSLFDDAAWHQVRVDIAPAKRGNAAQVVFDFDNGAYGGYGDIVNYNLASPAYLGFSARTGGATNNHWVKDISTSAAATAAVSDGCGSADLSAITETYCPATRDPNAVVPSVCPPGCATRLTPWFRSCASSQTFRQLDQQLGRDLTRFQALCASSVRGPPSGGGH